MSQSRLNDYAYYQGQDFPAYDDRQPWAFDVSQPPFVPHRQSDPGNMDLSRYDQMARNTVNEVPVHHLTKHEHNTPWDGQSRNGFTQPLPSPSWQENPNRGGAMTEPAPSHEPYLVRNNSQKGSEAADSGYSSQGPTANVMLDTFNSNRKELEQDYNVHDQFSTGSRSIDDNNHQAANRPTVPRSIVSDSQYLAPSGGGTRKQGIPACLYPGCGRRPKNRSDAKKHALTHIKPYRCKESDCNRKDGFATENDLQRHRKSVHNLRPTVGSPAGYICKACPIPDAGGLRKFWPRRDNFKAHIKRKHPEHDEDNLLEASKQTMRPDDTQTADDVSIAMHSALQSQVDPIEGNTYQISSDLSRGASNPNDFNLFSDSALEQREDVVIGNMGGATASDMGQIHYNPMSASPSDPLSLIPLMPTNTDYPDPSSYSPAYKKPRFDQVPYGSHHDQSHGLHLQVPDASVTMSRSNSMHSAVSTSSAQGDFQCPKCPKIKKRECDLKKHMKRHTRPYGCTFPHCQKKFGSRNDWKRHESSQHFLQEMWKCERQRVDGMDCLHRPFYQQEQLKRHLRGPDHCMDFDPEVDAECRRFRLGREAHEHFWCGFCKEIVSQSRTLQNTWDARFKHIGDHFDKENCDSGEWVCIEENKAKKYINHEEQPKDSKRRSRTGRHEDEEEDELPSCVIPGFSMGAGMMTVPLQQQQNYSSGTGLYTSNLNLNQSLGHSNKRKAMELENERDAESMSDNELYEYT